jgi:hypothetical protein
MQSISTKPARNLWPWAIIAWFVVFTAAMAAWITVALRQNLDLVRTDYYEEEIRFQRQLDRLNRTALVRHEVAVGFDAATRAVTVRLPAAHLSPPPTGTVQFYRPSDAALDLEVPLVIDESGLQRISSDRLRGGLWKIRVQWSAVGQEYFFEQSMVVEEARPILGAVAIGEK